MAINPRPAGLGRPLPAPDQSVEWTLEHDGVVFRRADLESGDHHRLVALQAAIWDPEMATPAHQLIAAETCGGIVLGAFRGDEAVGLSYAFPAHRLGEVWLHSHQTGVLDRHRGQGVGATLKWLQRWLALEDGYAVISWTFDPLQSRNAYFNFAKLGVVARTYKVNCYGPLPDASNKDLPTDRLWVEWHLQAPAVVDRFAGYRAASGIGWSPPPDSTGGPGQQEVAPNPGVAWPPERAEASEVVPTRSDGDGIRMPLDAPSLDGRPPLLRLEVPADLDRVRRRYGVAGATAWRMVVQRAFIDAFDSGYVATGFSTAMTDRGRRGWYVLVRSDR